MFWISFVVFFYLVYCCAYLFIVTLISSDILFLWQRDYGFLHTASPNLELVLRWSSLIYSSFDNRSKSSLDIDGKTTFLSFESLNKAMVNMYFFFILSCIYSLELYLYTCLSKLAFMLLFSRGFYDWILILSDGWLRCLLFV